MKTSYLLGASILLLVTLTGCPDEGAGNDPVDAMEDMTTAPDLATDMQQADDLGEQGSDMAMPDLTTGEDMAPDMVVQPEDMGQDMDPDMQDPEEMGSDFPPVTTDPLGGDRPATVILPTGFDNAEQVPLVILLHGYTASGAIQNAYFQISQQVDQKNFVLLLPDGTQEAVGDMNRFWNGTDACCNFFGSTVDDVAYLKGLIDESSERFNIDRGRVYLLGHSNGGFMSFRMACDAADYVTGIFSLAGATYKDMSSCQPSRPVHIVQMHGTADGTISYEGGPIYPQGPLYPSAQETVEHWAGYNGCTPGLTDLMVGDVANAATMNTTVQGFDGCPEDGSVELWTIQGGSHVPMLTTMFAGVVLEHLFAFDRTP